MQTIQLGGGHTAILDDEDHERLAQHKWHVTTNTAYPYAYRNVTVDGVRSKVLMHHDVVGREDGKVIDHANQNTLDNRKMNLRVCTHAENMRNTKKRDTNYRSPFKGVEVLPCGTCLSRITVNGEKVNLGYFPDEYRAAKQYDRAARVFFGEFARTNEMLGLL